MTITKPSNHLRMNSILSPGLENMGKVKTDETQYSIGKITNLSNSERHF